jgi:hypothetical protein
MSKGIFLEVLNLFCLILALSSMIIAGFYNKRLFYSLIYFILPLIMVHE